MVGLPHHSDSQLGLPCAWNSKWGTHFGAEAAVVDYPLDLGYRRHIRSDRTGRAYRFGQGNL